MHKHQDYPELDPNQQHHLLSGGLDRVWVKPKPLSRGDEGVERGTGVPLVGARQIPQSKIQNRSSAVIELVSESWCIKCKGWKTFQGVNPNVGVEVNATALNGVQGSHASRS